MISSAFDSHQDDGENTAGARCTLMMEFRGPRGVRYAVAVDLDRFIAGEIEKINPPRSEFPVAAASLDAVVEVLRKRQFRKELFTAEAKRLGMVLAERMEDAEGWHDASRIGPAKDALSNPRRIARQGPRLVHRG